MRGERDAGRGTARWMGWIGAAAVAGVAWQAAAGGTVPRSFRNAAGRHMTVARPGRINEGRPFFQDLGANGRRCSTCHAESDGWSITPTSIQARFETTGGDDPLFRTNDGTVAPGADISTLEARRAAYGMLLSKGLIRVGLPIPVGAEFALESVDDPYGFASAQELSLFRRPLPATNLKSQSVVMWDGRNTRKGRSLVGNLTEQASGATTGHAQAPHPPSDAQLKDMVAQELGFTTAQTWDRKAGLLSTQGAKAGPQNLARQPYHDGINPPFGERRGERFTPIVFNLFQRWSRQGVPADVAAARASIQRGETLFNRKPFIAGGVAGLNDVQHKPLMTVTCSTCHNTPNDGGSSVGALMDIGVGDESRRTAEVPLYTLRRLQTGELRSVTDPGRALITGKWADVGRFKIPTLRGLSARPPYFHDGSAATLRDVVDFYDQRFEMELDEPSKQDLTNFLAAL